MELFKLFEASEKKIVHLYYCCSMRRTKKPCIPVYLDTMVGSDHYGLYVPPEYPHWNAISTLSHTPYTAAFSRATLERVRTIIVDVLLSAYQRVARSHGMATPRANPQEKVVVMYYRVEHVAPTPKIVRVCVIRSHHARHPTRNGFVFWHAGGKWSQQVL